MCKEHRSQPLSQPQTEELQGRTQGEGSLSSKEHETQAHRQWSRFAWTQGGREQWLCRELKQDHSQETRWWQTFPNKTSGPCKCTGMQCGDARKEGKSKSWEKPERSMTWVMQREDSFLGPCYQSGLLEIFFWLLKSFSDISISFL